MGELEVWEEGLEMKIQYSSVELPLSKKLKEISLICGFKFLIGGWWSRIQFSLFKSRI